MCCSSVNKCISIVVSVVLGIGVALLFYLGLIPNVLFGIIAALAASGVMLVAISILTAALAKTRISSSRCCICEMLKLAVVATLATIVTGIVALLFTLSTDATLIASLVIIFLVTTFFVLTIISVYSLFKCVIDNIIVCD